MNDLQGTEIKKLAGRMPHNFRDLTGCRFGRLLIVGRDLGSHDKIKWICICDCGTETLASTDMLKSGRTQSCGCLAKELLVARNRAAAIHGEADKSLEYRSWVSMKSRCLNPNNRKYHRWGGNGVTICERWQTSFSAFLADMGRRPTPKHTLDRYPDPAGNYEPGNCRWATALQQRHNRRK